MPNLAFERPVLGLAAFLTPIALIIGARFFKGALSLSISLGPPGGEFFQTPFSSSITTRICRIISYAGISLLVFAASGPFFITPSTVWFDRGADILFVIDCSPSMAALDMDNKRRFDVACQLVREFSLNRPADAIGIAEVGSDAALALPPTTDRTALFAKLDGIRIGEMGDGTALGVGLAIAASHIAPSKAPRKAVVLITDGENNAGSIHPETAAKILSDYGISLYIIAVGSTGEVPIDYVNPVTNMRRTGTLDSRYSIEAIARIAEAGNGMFLSAPSADAFARAFAQVSNAEMTISRSGVRETKTPFHNMFVIIAGSLIAFSVFFRKFVLGAFL